MATIPLTEIPNAPMDVAAPVADPQFKGDQVGDSAIAGINRSFEGMKVNPLAAAVGGEMMIKAGQQITQFGNNVSEGLGRMAMTKNLKDEFSGQVKYYQNKINLDQQYGDAILGQPVEQHPVIYKNIYGDQGKNLYAGMSPQEARWQMPEVMRTYTAGMISEVNKVHNFQNQQLQGAAIQNFDHALNTGDLKSAAVFNDSAAKNGYFTGEMHARNSQIIANKYDVQTLRQAIDAAPSQDWNAKIYEAYRSEKPLDLGNGVVLSNLSTVDKRNLMNYANVAKGDDEWNKAAPIQAQIDAGQITDPNIIQNDKTLTPEWKQILTTRMTNNLVGTPIGNAYTLQGQQMVDSFPQADSPEGMIKEFYDKQKWIAQHVGGVDAQTQQDALNKMRKEMAANGGKISDDAAVKAFGVQYLDAAKNAGIFGQVPTEKEIKDNPAKAAQLLSVEQRIADIKKGLEGGYDFGDGKRPIKTTEDMKQAIQGMLKPAEAAKFAPKMQESFGDMLKRTLQGMGDSFGVPDSEFQHSQGQSTAPAFSGSQASGNPIIPVKGVVTTYGYEKKGQKYHDRNSARGIGDHDNKLVEGSSVALSPEMKDAAAKAGIPKGGQMYVHLEGVKQPVLVTNDDTTDRDMTGRVDFYNKTGPQKNPYEGKKVIGIQKI